MLAGIAGHLRIRHVNRFLAAAQSVDIDVDDAFHAARAAPRRNTTRREAICQGSVTGQLSVPDQDVDGDGTGDPSATATTLSLRVDVDCVRVQGNRAVLAGQVRESNVSTYVGRRMLLTVEDGGEGKNAGPDRYTWGQYRSTAATWIASDGELAFDPGVGLTWIATDSERTDDVGIPSNPPAGIDCQSFPLSSYALEDLPLGSGNIQVKP